MSTPASNIPISVDYTSKDYYALREELIARVQDRLPNWTATDPADFGVALVESFSYLGDLLNYYIDRNANESFISTATQRKSVLNIAQSYGYTPAGYRQSIVELTFTNTSSTSQSIPSGTEVSGELVVGDTVKTIYFTLKGNVSIPGSSTAVTTGYQGRSIIVANAGNSNAYGEKIGVSTGAPNMSWQLSSTPVVDGSIELYVQTGTSWSKWTQVQHILDYGPSDLVFTVYTDENDYVSINFGDGVSGSIPTLGNEIRAKYTLGGGAEGNIETGVIKTISYAPGKSESELTVLNGIVTVTNTGVGIGGSDPESIDEIRVAAPLAFRTNNRAVTLQDFADLSLNVTGVGKTNATASVWTSVTVYIAPSRSETEVDLQPGYLSDGTTVSDEYNTLKTLTESYLSDKTLIGTTVSIQPPTYVDLIITITYTKMPQYTTAELDTAIKTKLFSAFGYTNMSFQQTIYPQDIEFELAQIPGIKVAKVTALRKNGLTISSASGSGTQIQYTLNDNPSFEKGSIVTVTGLSPSGYNVTNAEVIDVGTNTFKVSGAQTGSSSGTGTLTGLFIMSGAADEIFRFKESNVTVSGS